MRVSIFSILVTAALVAGCNDRPGNPTSPPSPRADASTISTHAGGDTPKSRVYEPGTPIPVKLSMKSKEEGGRSEPFYGTYESTVTFERQTQGQPCTIEIGIASGFAPGTTHDVVMKCGKPIAVAEGAMRLTLAEGDRLVGTGLVIPN